MQEDVEVQRRRYQRIALVEKITGTLDHGEAVVIDVSLSGAFVAHKKQVENGEVVLLQFDWRGAPIAVTGEVVRTFVFRHGTRTSQAVYRSGIRFLRFQEESAAFTLRRMVDDLVSRALDERRANARGIPPEAPASRQQNRKASGYVSYRLIDGKWLRTRSREAVQPRDGFTISTEEEERASLLCSVYERSSETERDLLRSMAQHSISDSSGLPVRRFEP